MKMIPPLFGLAIVAIAFALAAPGCETMQKILKSPAAAATGRALTTMAIQAAAARVGESNPLAAETMLAILQGVELNYGAATTLDGANHDPAVAQLEADLATTLEATPIDERPAVIDAARNGLLAGLRGSHK